MRDELGHEIKKDGHRWAVFHHAYLRPVCFIILMSMRPVRIATATLLGIAMYVVGLVVSWLLTSTPFIFLQHLALQPHWTLYSILSLNIRTWWGLTGQGSILLIGLLGRPKISMAFALPAGILTGFFDRLLLLAIVTER